MSFSDDEVTPAHRPSALLQDDRRYRPRTESAVQRRNVAVEALDLRLQSTRLWSEMLKADRQALRSIVGEAIDHGARLNEASRLRIESKLIEARAEVARLRGRLAKDQHERAIASTIPPPAEAGGES